MLRRIRLGLWVVALVGAVGLGLVVWSQSGPAATQIGHGVYLNAPFKLIAHDGQEVSRADFSNKPTAWFFGFTHCPDVCPTTLFQMTEHLKSLGRDGDRLNVVFVTVDPERDTPAVLKEYLTSFDPRIVGLTGSPEQIRAAVKGFFAHAAKVPQKDGGYTMEHSSLVFLTAQDGQFKGTLDQHEPV